MLILSTSIALALLVATLIVEFRLACTSSSELNNNRKRIQTWWAILAICSVIFYFGGWAITAFTYVLIYWAAFECSRLLHLSITPINLIIFTLTLISYHALTILHPELKPLFFIIPFCTILALGALSIWFPKLAKLKTVLLLFLCIVTIFSIDIIRQYAIIKGVDAGLLLLFLLFITACNDIFQYLSGKIFGRIPLASGLSKNKTLEGASGGFILTCLLCTITMPQLFNVTAKAALLVGAVISILGILGDLQVSFLKREAGVKDTGASLPGHGGLLDRIDSLSLTAPGFGLCLGVILV